MTHHDRCTIHAAGAPVGMAQRQDEWGRRLAALVLGWMAFETLSGASLYLLPFSVPNQWLVLIHTGAGLLLLVPSLVYQARHLAVYWSRPASPVKWMGWLATAATLAAIVSGVVLTWQALLGRRIASAWDLAHVIATVAVVAFLAPHVVIILVRDRRVGRRTGSEGLLRAQRRALARAAAATAAGFALAGGAFWLQPGTRLVHAFPTDYSFRYGTDRPFAPSLAKTASGGPYDTRLLSGSESCGTSGCHEEIAAEWRVSAHRWAAMDPGFQRIQEEMAKQNGAESTRYCAGCHDPISLFAGAKTVFTKNLTESAGHDEGV